MRVAVAVDDIFEKGDNRVAIELLDGLHFNPLGELVNHDQEVSHASAGCLESSHHVQAPNDEGLGDGDGSEGESWQMALLGEVLASLALQDQVFSVCLGGWLVVAVPKGLVCDHAGRSVMAALSLVDVLEELSALVGVDAALEDSRDASPVQLSIDDGEGLGSALDMPCLHFIFGQRTVAQVVEVRLSPGGSCTIATIS